MRKTSRHNGHREKTTEKQHRHTREKERMANATENNRETKPPHHTREREGATQIDVHFLTTEQGIQYTFVSTPAKSKRCDPWVPGPRNSVANSVAMSFGSRQRRATERSLGPCYRAPEMLRQQSTAMSANLVFINIDWKNQASEPEGSRQKHEKPGQHNQ